jgi:capsid protein
MTAILDSTGRPVPSAAIRRVRMRAMYGDPATEGVGWPAFAYDAADITSQEMGGWWPFLRSPDYEINRDRDRMVARVRDLIRNDGWGTGAVNRILDNTVGAQFLLISKPDYMALRAVSPKFDATWAAEFAAVVDAGWRTFADDPAHQCDASRVQTMTQMFYTLTL